MAQAGTPMDLAKQPAKSSSSGQVGLWRALFTTIVILAIAFGMVVTASFLAGANHSTAIPVADHSYDQIEAQRGAVSLSLTKADGSQDKIESQRGTPQSVTTGGSPYDQIDNLKANLRGTAPVIVSNVDHRYDNVDNLRGNLR